MTSPGIMIQSLPSSHNPQSPLISQGSITGTPRGIHWDPQIGIGLLYGFASNLRGFTHLHRNMTGTSSWSSTFWPAEGSSCTRGTTLAQGGELRNTLDWREAKEQTKRLNFPPALRDDPSGRRAIFTFAFKQ